MRYTKLVFLCAFALMCICVNAQVQKGQVRTISRPNKPSKPVAGVSIKLSGAYNTVMTDENGFFYIRVDGIKEGSELMLQSVKKSGYTLADPGIIGRKFAMSLSVDLVISMVNLAEANAEKEQLAKKVQAELEKKLNTQIAGYEEKIALYESLIEPLTEYCTQLDIYKMTENDKLVTTLVETGELQKAQQILDLVSYADEQINGFIDSFVASYSHIDDDNCLDAKKQLDKISADFFSQNDKIKEPFSELSDSEILQVLKNEWNASQEWNAFVTTLTYYDYSGIEDRKSSYLFNEQFPMVTIDNGDFITSNGTTIHLSSFEIGKYPVTQSEWESIMGYNNSSFKGGKNPVENVTIDEVNEFIRRLNEKTGKNFRLPRSDEWFVAAKGGGGKAPFTFSGSNALNDVAWNKSNSSGTTHPVGQKKPNQLGIYDMCGNVWEMCSDGIIKGGSYVDGDVGCCNISNNSFTYSKDYCWNWLGFRLACGEEQAGQKEPYQIVIDDYLSTIEYLTLNQAWANFSTGNAAYAQSEKTWEYFQNVYYGREAKVADELYLHNKEAKKYEEEARKVKESDDDAYMENCVKALVENYKFFIIYYKLFGYDQFLYIGSLYNSIAEEAYRLAYLCLESNEEEAAASLIELCTLGPAPMECAYLCGIKYNYPSFFKTLSTILPEERLLATNEDKDVCMIAIKMSLGRTMRTPYYSQGNLIQLKN